MVASRFHRLAAAERFELLQFRTIEPRRVAGSLRVQVVNPARSIGQYRKCLPRLKISGTLDLVHKTRLGQQAEVRYTVCVLFDAEKPSANHCDGAEQSQILIPSGSNCHHVGQSSQAVTLVSPISTPRDNSPIVLKRETVTVTSGYCDYVA